MKSRRPMPVDWLFPVLCGVGTVWLLWHGLVTLPHEYDALSTRGVPVEVQVVRCGTGQGNDSHGFGCQVRTDRAGRVHQWRVDRDVRTETGVDGTAPGLVDPDHPGHSALVEDAARRTGTGGPVVGFAALSAAAGIGTTVLLVRHRRRWAARLPR